MGLSKITKLKNEFSELADRYHDCLIYFEAKGDDLLLVREATDNHEIFEVKMNGRLIDSFTIYENLDEDHRLHYEITDNDEIGDLENCRFELIDIFATSRDLLLIGVKIGEQGYGNDIVLELSDIDYVKI